MSSVVMLTSMRAFCLMLNVIATMINRKDKLYNKTIVDYWDIGYDVDIHH